jgi:D-alanine-D-alanine ligase
MEIRELKTKKIGVLLGGRSSEREISLKSGNAVLESLLRSGYNATGIDARDRLAETLRQRGIEIAFIALHGVKTEQCRASLRCSVSPIPVQASPVPAWPWIKS